MSVRVMGLLSRLRGTRSRRSTPHDVADFDPAFYRARYQDVAGGSDAELTRHYADHGHAEGRAGNPAALIAQLEARQGALPLDFDPEMYRRLNNDLPTALSESWALTAHFLEHGRAEGRQYFGVDTPAVSESAAVQGTETEPRTGSAAHAPSETAAIAEPSFDDPDRFVNVASGKPAAQSSRPAWCDVGPEALALGDPAREFNLHTEDDDEPWWRVDLGRRLPLAAIVVHNRREALLEGARHLRAEISEDGETWTLVHAGLAHFGSAGRGTPLVLPLGGRAWARHVRLSLDERQPLVLSRVEVLVARSSLELLRLREALSMDSPLLMETEDAVEQLSYDLIAAPGTREGPLIGLAVAFSPAVGNGLTQHVLAVLLARRLGLRFIRLAPRDTSGMIARDEPETIGGITFLPANYPLPRGGWFLEGYFWERMHFLKIVPHLDPIQVREVVRTVIHPLFNRLPKVFPRKADDELLIHIRSGDIFSTWVNAVYIQPPLAYYTLIVDRFLASGKARRMRLVYEDRRNPVIPALEAHLAVKGIPFMVQSGTIVDDVTALVNGRHLVFGFGTFGPAICQLSDEIETVVTFHYSIDQGFRGIATVRNLVEVIDGAGLYIKPGEWRNTDEQRRQMVEYREANLRLVGEL